jgi:phosphoribosylformimino-5-aminoimidazole carboxamide ribotide isomerase
MRSKLCSFLQDDLDFVQRISNGKVDLSIGSALDIFGGDIKYKDVVAWQKDRT